MRIAAAIVFLLSIIFPAYGSSSLEHGSPPAVSIVSPLRHSNQATGTITFSANETATYQCSLDGAKFIACTSPFEYGGLANGQHTFSVIATDREGKIGRPVSCTWRVNTALSASSAVLLPQTGQTKCYDNAGGEIACDGSGQEQTGVPWPEPRFVDNKNGTVTDALTGLVWLKNADCFGIQSWTDALARVKNLAHGQCGLCDGSGAGVWRLPNIIELESLLDLQYGDPPLLYGHPFTNVHYEEDYWSSSTYVGNTSHSWYIYLSDGYVGRGWPKSNVFYVWPVRSGAEAVSAVNLPWSGQSRCYDSEGAVIPCIGTGQDGEVQSGIPWPAPRFSDNGDGTCTDHLTGLVWSKDSNPAGEAMPWQTALDYISSLNRQNWLGYSDWRLPNRKELMSLIDREQAGGTNWLMNQGFLNISENLECWSSCTYSNQKNCAWYVDMNHGDTHGQHKFYCTSHVWPVRGGYVMQKLSITKTGSGTITSSSGTLAWNNDTVVARMLPGETVTLYAVPGAGFKFGGWSGDCTGSGNCTVTMNVAKNIMATFIMVAPVATQPISLVVLTKNTTNGKISLVSGRSATSGAVYTFEYSNDGGATWINGYSGENRKPTILLKVPGTYQFRVFVTANGFTPSAPKAGNTMCVFRADKRKYFHTR